MAYRDYSTSMPAIDDIIMQVLGISASIYNMQCIIGWSAYDDHRPPGWPTARAFLRFYGYPDNADGWKAFADMHIGYRVVEMHDHRAKLRRREKWCKVCGDLEVAKLGRCLACYEFYRRNHKDRPRHLWDSEARCSNCKIPLSSVGEKAHRGGWKRRRQNRGRCDTCDSYWRKYHIERPQRLWGDGPHGWCMCGYPAVALVAGDIPVCSRHQE